MNKLLKTLLQILGIVSLFFLLGYVLTYPYELSYRGNDAIKLFEDSYEKASFEELINRKEFEGKVLYVKIWEPFDEGNMPYTRHQQEVFKDLLDSIRNDIGLEEYKFLSLRLRAGIGQSVPTPAQIAAIESVNLKYNSRDFAMLHIANPDTRSKTKNDDFRKWKMAIKKYKLQGYHLLMNANCYKQVRQSILEKTKHPYLLLPLYLLIDKQGHITNYQAAWPQDSTMLYTQIDSLLVR
ncbi:hypothetical protein [Chondrinema litorale]|uniref:hypothetical protein n=1 Tax=Chondrinema litorale TaxID=2994555 RepID=UPI002542D331|nr:hypothetical protein [Chondrinema litorale]UZR96409.1 hypothetical protein OQ292_22390 [Chondrinema litorale]